LTIQEERSSRAPISVVNAGHC